MPRGDEGLRGVVQRQLREQGAQGDIGAEGFCGKSVVVGSWLCEGIFGVKGWEKGRGWKLLDKLHHVESSDETRGRKSGWDLPARSLLFNIQ